MAQNIIGRHYERQILEECVSSSEAEFVAVYGRRRVGKTFLVRQHFDGRLAFYATGILDGSRSEQLSAFHQQLELASGRHYPHPSDWMDAFGQLRDYLTTLPDGRIVVFLDELPWFDTRGARFKQAFSYFWNAWGSTCDRLTLIVCGSATTWMLDELLGSRGGLHNRVTRSIHLAPFTLAETEEYLQSRGIVWSRYQIANVYMAVGGTPYYLSKIRRGQSVPQAIDELFFSPSAELRQEFTWLFRSLFGRADVYQDVVRALSHKAKGLTRLELQQAVRIGDGGTLTTVLRNLENCDFIRRYNAFGKKERDAMYQLTDLFTLFYLNFVQGTGRDDTMKWTAAIDSPHHRAWSGYAFEMVSLLHVEQIKRRLGIAGVQTSVSSWTGDGAQIDLVIDRRDQTVNLCEIKYSLAPFVLTEAYLLRLRERLEMFRAQTRTRKALHLTMVTTYGLKPNTYSGEVQNVVTLDDLFAAEHG